ncbi:MAG: T9SS type A sorting domain-containing protein, partial [Bacteroidia bacterium]|nr:T9SS type A sorting domain-containing protein [Bacteroidia bacterium]
VRPIAIAQNVTAYLNATGTATVSASQVNNGSSDNVGISGLTLSQSSFACNNTGLNTVTLTVTDNSGNFRTAQAIVTVLDTIKPIVAGQNLTVYLNALGSANISATQITSSSSDNCSITSIVASKTSFDCSNLGSNTVILTATDASSNVGTVNVTVTVSDTTRPVALINNNVNIYLNALGTATLSTSQVNNGSSDNCTISSIVLGKTTFTSADLGANVVTFTITDQSNNSRIVNVNVNVLDSIKPIALAQNRTIYLNGLGTTSITASEVNNSSTDNVGIANLSLSQTNFNCNNLGANNVVLTVTDASGNFATASAIITVVDSIKPTLSANNLTVYINSLGFASITTAQATSSSSDNCSSVTMSLSQSSFDCSDLGVNSVNLTATDGSNNSSSASFVVNVLDSLKPNVFVNNNLSIYLDANGTVNLTPAEIDGGSTDNCSIALMSLSKSSFNGSNLGSNVITFTVTDQSNNFRTVNVTVFVRDTMVPIIKAKDLALYLGSTGVVSLTTTMVDDGSTDNVAITNRSLSKSFFNCQDVGVNNIHYTIRDASGNESTIPVNITILDTILPKVTSQPLDKVVGFCNDVINYNMPTASDNCSIVTVTQTAGLPSGSKFPIGLTLNTFEISDASANKVTVSFRVVVVPETVIDTFPDLTMCGDAAPINLSQGIPNLTFSGSGMKLDKVTFDPAISGSGTFIITANFLDTMGCVSTGSFTVVVYRVPDKPTIIRQSASQLSADRDYDFYQWYRNNEILTGETGKTISVTQSGVYGLVVRNTNGCINGSDPFPLGTTIGGATIIKDKEMFNLYPNPTSDKFFIELKNIEIKDTEISIIDMLGKEVMRFNASDNLMEIGSLDLSPGAYHVKLQNGNRVMIKQIVIAR